MAKEAQDRGGDSDNAIRLQLGHELHDGPLQLVVGAKMLVESLAGRVASGAAITVADLDRIAKLLGDAVRDTRQIILDTRPLPPNMSWTEGVRGWVQEHYPQDPVHLDLEGPVAEVPEAVGAAAYRIACEAIRNAVRHARPHRVEVSADRNEDALVLRIVDDGVGFDPQDLPDGHFGVRGILERARQLNGDARIDSRPGGGTRITVRLPY